MHLPPWRRCRTAASCVAIALGAAACTDATPVAPAGGGATPPGGGPGGGGTLSLVAVHCTAEPRAEKLECGSADTGGAQGDIIVGGQNVYVKLTSSNVNYDAGTGAFTFDVTLRNLIPQAMGTTDGVTLAPSGVRIFFHNGPTVTAGTGAVTVVGDGTAAFTGANQPYYQYNAVLDQYELSPTRQWRLDMPTTVTGFAFTLFVSAPVRYPDGWIDLEPAVYAMPALAQKQISAIVRSAVGNPDAAAPVVWSTADPLTAVIDAAGMTTGVRAGTTTVLATAGPRTGTSTLNISGIKRYWTGRDASTPTEWVDGDNWTPLGVAPVSADTAVINGDSATVFPVLTQNVTIGGVIMEPGALAPSLSLGVFDLSLTASIDQGTTGQVLGTGRMIFTGTAQTIGGTTVDYRNARFTGSYSLNNNLTVTGGRIVVQGGRLRSTSNRIRVRPN